jgi:hypothetical protein
MLRCLLTADRRIKYRNGRRLRGMIAYDAMVEVEVIDSSRVDEGILLIRHRGIDTWEGSEPGPFSSVLTLPIAKRWKLETYIGHSTRNCSECGSLFYPENVHPLNLCPECRHLLYGHERCVHTFAEGRCSRCYRDGSVSDYCKGLKREGSR